MKTLLLVTFLLASVVVTTRAQYRWPWDVYGRLEKAPVVGLEERDTGRSDITGDQETIQKLGSSSNIQE